MNGAAAALVGAVALATAEVPASSAVRAWHAHSRHAEQRAEDRRLPPRDDARFHKGFVAFRNQLLAAAEAGDRARLRAHMSESISTLDSRVTPDRLMDAAGVRAGRRWAVLADALRAGVVVSGDSETLVAPYYAEAPIDFDEALVLGVGVRLRSRPEASAPVVGRLIYDVVSVRQLNLRGAAEDWSEVQTARGLTGFVATRYLKSPYDARFFFARQDGGWKLVSYAVGD